MSNIIKAGIIQQKNTSNADDNIKKLKDNILKAASAGCQIVVLQELHNTLYFCQNEDENNFDLAETIPGPSTEFYSRLAKECRIVLVTSLFEKRAPGLFHNTAIVFENNGSIAGKYRKMHIPDDPGFYEKFYFAPGDTGFEPIPTSVGKLGVLICWDQWYPEAARIMSLKGADILIYPTAIGWNPMDADDEKKRQRDSWIISQKAHAIANGLPVLSVNRTGFEADGEGGIDFWGTSFICGPQGEIIAEASISEEEVLIADIDKSRTENVRRIWPFFRDRRIDEYNDILKRYAD